MLLTEDKLRQIVRETIENIVNEDIDIDVINSNQNLFNKAHIWRNAVNEIEKDGYTFVNIPVNNNTTLKFKLMKHRLGCIQMEYNNTTKLFPSIGDTFSFIKQYTERIMRTLNKFN